MTGGAEHVRVRSSTLRRLYSQWVGWIVVAVVAADWWSKFLVLNRIPLHDRVAVLDGWFYLVRTRNHGVAFGVLDGRGAAWLAPVLVAAACLVLVVLGRLALAATDRVTRAGIALLIGGALGNVGDRIANGGVTDFLWVSFFPFIFNIADVAVVCGALLLALQLSGESRAPRRSRRLV